MSAPRFVVGAALRVHVVDAARWNADAGLQGQVGIVAEVLAHERMTGHPKAEPAYLLTFDPPLAKVWKWGSPITGHWFDESELTDDLTATTKGS